MSALVNLNSILIKKILNSYTIFLKYYFFKFMDKKSSYMATDLDYSLDLFRTYLSFIEKNWNNLPGRPTVVFVITKDIYGIFD